jgi:serine/threonine protein kinase
VIIFEDGYVKLTDFGLSRAMIEDEKAKTEAGTILYFAPEIVERKGYCKLVDLWQLGVFAYELATSESPFRQEQILIKGRFEDVIRKF